MNKEEFKCKITALREEIAHLKSEYVETNTEYPNGTRVKVTDNRGKSRIGVVKFTIVEGFDAVPYIVMITKAGEESVRRICVYPGDTIEVIG